MKTGLALLLSYLFVVSVGLLLIPIALSPWRVEVALGLLLLGILVVIVLAYVHVSDHLNEQDLRQQRYKFHEEQPLSQGAQPKVEGMSSYYVPYQQQQYQRPYQYQGAYDEQE